MEDLISLLVVPYSLVPYCIAVYTQEIRWIYLGALVLISIATTSSIKLLTNHMPYKCLKRPDGARNCNTFLTDGDQSGRPGFPSGHCAGTATFWVGIWILYSNKISVGVLAIVGILSMMWARRKKRCHTLVQTIAGVAVGSGYALLLH